MNRLLGASVGARTGEKGTGKYEEGRGSELSRSIVDLTVAKRDPQVRM
jgi:hypothetical protein